MRLLAAARRQLADARVAGISAETRFGAAYAAIRMIADAGLNAHGFRTLTSRPGHHQTAIQSLTKTFAVPGQTVVVLDGLRKQRHLIEYTGETVPESMVVACIAEAERLLAHASEWLGANKPRLI
jgi:hypothetical protein